METHWLGDPTWRTGIPVELLGFRREHLLWLGKDEESRALGVIPRAFLFDCEKGESGETRFVHNLRVHVSEALGTTTGKFSRDMHFRTELLSPLLGPQRTRQIAFSPDGGLVAIEQDDRRVSLARAVYGDVLRKNQQQLPTSATLQLLPMIEGEPPFAFRQPGHTILVWNQQARVFHLRSTATGVLARTIPWSEKKNPTLLEFDRNGAKFAVADEDGVLTVLDTITGNVLGRYAPGHGAVVQLHWVDKRRQLVAFHRKNFVSIVHRETGETKTHPCPAWSVCTCAPSGKTAAFASGTVLRTMQLSTGELRGGSAGHEGAIRSLCFVPETNELLSASDDGTIRRWNIAKRKTVQLYEGFRAPPTDLCMHPDRQSFLSVSSAGTELLHWHIASGEFRRWTIPLRGRYHLRCSPDGQEVFLYADGDCFLVALATGTIESYPGIVAAGFGTHDGRVHRLLLDDRANVLSELDGKRQRLKRMKNSVVRTGCHFSPNGRFLANLAGGLVELGAKPTESRLSDFTTTGATIYSDEIVVGDRYVLRANRSVGAFLQTFTSRALVFPSRRGNLLARTAMAVSDNAEVVLGYNDGSIQWFRASKSSEHS